ncbi:MAG: aminotransferase class V-fold PLP-dependent enzyme [Gammaproteobacteria bacterium]|nr:aminotransferase class V-fold PLP-dependent enzyme [Gammaproteobacteria bacterium]
MLTCLEKQNLWQPASTHSYGQQAALKIEEARAHVANLLNADPREIIWTSGATESNNLGIQGVAHFYQKRKKHIITMKTEHKAVLDVCQFLEKQGFEVSYLAPHPNGLIDLSQLRKALRSDTLLVSIMMVNNETGIIQPIEKIATIVKENGSFLHVDAAQAVGKVEIDLKKLPIDLLSLSAHKIYGPKGVGALVVKHRPAVRLEPLLYGGGHEKGLRSGTLATHQIVGLGEACAILQEKMKNEITQIRTLKESFWEKIKRIADVHKNGANEDKKTHACHILNVHFSEIDSDILMRALPELAISSGSACTSLSIRPSHVLQAMGLSDEWAHRSLRFSFGRFTTEDEIERAAQLFTTIFKKLRK